MEIIKLQLRTQIQRETLLAKEAKYEHGLKKNDFDFEDIVSAMQDSNESSKNEHSSSK